MRGKKFFKLLWAGWKRIGKRLGDFQARAILTVLYFVVVAPFALLVRFAADPLSIKGQRHNWRVKEKGKGTAMSRALTQF